jgi:hypothetical protein
MTLIRLTLVIGLLIASIVIFWRIAPSRSKLLILRDATHFPVISGFNLNRQEFEFPRDFEGDLNLVIVAFQQYQQRTVNTWLPYAQELESTFSKFIYYELPTISDRSVLSRTFINEGMRAGIPDQTARERTITLYLNKGEFRSALDIPNEDDIYLFLVDQNGNVFWHSSGEYSEAKASELIEVIEAQSQQGK